MHLLLLGPIPTQCEPYLRDYLTTPWSIVGVRDVTDRAAVRGALRDADALISVSFEPDMTDAAGKLRLLAVPGAGVDAVQRSALPARCAVTNVFEHETPIAEYVMLNVLLHATEQNRYARTMRQGRWDGSGRHFGAFHDDVLGMTRGVVGYGRIGRAVATRARAFGMRTCAVRQAPAPDEALDWCGGIDQLDRLLAEADYLVLACPLTDQTRGVLGEAQ